MRSECIRRGIHKGINVVLWSLTFAIVICLSWNLAGALLRDLQLLDLQYLPLMKTWGMFIVLFTLIELNQFCWMKLQEHMEKRGGG